MSGRLPILDGRRFSCTQCGHCCSKDGLVYIHPYEIEQMAKHLGLDVRAFWLEFEVRHDSSSSQPVLVAKDGLGCPLLSKEKNCRVHSVKPLQCRSFPFWPELLDTASAWESARQNCPGMDAPEGRLYSVDEIRKIRDRGLSTN